MKIVYHPLMRESYDHTPAGAPRRLDTSVEILSKRADYEFVKARPASEEEINRAHAPGHIERVKRDYDSTKENLLYQVATLVATLSVIIDHADEFNSEILKFIG